MDRLMVDMAVKLGVRSASLSGSGTENASHASQHKDNSKVMDTEPTGHMKEELENDATTEELSPKDAIQEAEEV
eukprot:CAMPEP_0181521730 /NCGR_PEP_ID=MMETSP1110-20121109/66990_1 /TAXON_ID=174948 /ORGANISM="Symbiodinium sp., Strain CCMP421" /LENGTH=73 /DNA_ID=CAMNT_0023652287 /DNA_START=1 /DNA_END=222 /DNA_ORIENTATION=-